MPVSVSRRAHWTRQELLAWILHRRNSTVNEIAKVETEKGVGLLPSMEAGLTAYWATFARRGRGKFPTPGRVRAADRLLERGEAAGKITANKEGMFPSKVARELWVPYKSGRAPEPIHSIEEVYRLAAAIQEHPKSHYAPKCSTGRYMKESGVEIGDRGRQRILEQCGITAKKSSEVTSLFQAAIQLARKTLRDRQGTETTESVAEKPIRLGDGSVLHPSVSTRPSPLGPEEHKQRSQYVNTWARRGNPRVYD
jgi:hypothetical protein